MSQYRSYFYFHFHIRICPTWIKCMPGYSTYTRVKYPDIWNSFLHGTVYVHMCICMHICICRVDAMFFYVPYNCFHRFTNNKIQDSIKISVCDNRALTGWGLHSTAAQDVHCVCLFFLFHWSGRRQSPRRRSWAESDILAAWETGASLKPLCKHTKKNIKGNKKKYIRICGDWRCFFSLW